MPYEGSLTVSLIITVYTTLGSSSCCGNSVNTSSILSHILTNSLSPILPVLVPVVVVYTVYTVGVIDCRVNPGR